MSGYPMARSQFEAMLDTLFNKTDPTSSAVDGVYSQLAPVVGGVKDKAGNNTAATPYDSLRTLITHRGSLFEGHTAAIAETRDPFSALVDAQLREMAHGAARGSSDIAFGRPLHWSSANPAVSQRDFTMSAVMESIVKGYEQIERRVEQRVGSSVDTDADTHILVNKRVPPMWRKRLIGSYGGGGGRVTSKLTEWNVFAYAAALCGRYDCVMCRRPITSMTDTQGKAVCKALKSRSVPPHAFTTSDPMWHDSCDYSLGLLFAHEYTETDAFLRPYTAQLMHCQDSTQAEFYHRWLHLNADGTKRNDASMYTVPRFAAGMNLEDEMVHLFDCVPLAAVDGAVLPELGNYSDMPATDTTRYNKARTHILSQGDWHVAVLTYAEFCKRNRVDLPLQWKSVLGVHCIDLHVLWRKTLGAYVDLRCDWGQRRRLDNGVGELSQQTYEALFVPFVVLPKVTLRRR
jgi:hypothetical protein